MSKAAENFEQKCKRLFNEADKDGNGLSIGELRTLICTLCNNTQTTDRMIATMFADLDDDGDKKLSWDEFSEVCGRNPKSVQECELRDVFKKYDKDGSGFLTADEIKKAFAELGISSDPQKSLEAADKNADGKVNCDEFFAFWSK